MVENLQEMAIASWDEMRARYHAQVDATRNGDGGSTPSDGDGILQVRSGSQRVAASILYVTELLNGSGDLPDSESLLSFAVSAGQSVEDFTCMVLSLMFLTDSIFLMHSGKQDMVVQMFSVFMNEKAPPITAESTPLKAHGPKETTTSLEQEVASVVGLINKSDSYNPSGPPKKKKRAKAKSSPKMSGGRKAPPKKTRK